jgi:hypothetical protein
LGLGAGIASPPPGLDVQASMLMLFFHVVVSVICVGFCMYN